MEAGAKPGAIPGAAPGAWARAGAEELPIKAATARINRYRICLSVTLAELARLWDGFLAYRHPSDDGLIEAGCLSGTKTKIAASNERPATFALSGILYG
jgi:hypothetical protein